MRHSDSVGNPHAADEMAKLATAFDEATGTRPHLTVQSTPR